MRTDRQGHYRLYGLEPGEYAVGVSLAGFAERVGAGSEINPNGTGETFKISCGEEYNGIDVIFPSTQGRTIRGVISFPAVGKRFVVSLVPVQHPELSAAVIATDEQGRFTIDSATPGDYFLLASGPLIGHRGRVAVINSEAVFGRVRLQVAGQDIRDVLVPVHPGRNVKFAMTKTASAPSTCAGSAELILDTQEDWGVWLERRVEIGFSHVLIVENLAPGTYRVALANLSPKCFPEDVPILDLQPRDLGDPFVISIVEAGEIRGRVSGMDLTSGAVIVVIPAQPGVSSAGQMFRTTLAEPNGRFAFTSLRPGEYRIAVEPATSARRHRWTSDVSRMFEVEVFGGAVTEVEIPIAAPAALSR